MTPSITQRATTAFLDSAWTWSITPSEPASVREDRCAGLLRRYPFWTTGHRILAQLALDRDDIGRAYASAVCYRALCEAHAKNPSDALFILGQCFLRRGDWQRALEHLERAHELDSERAEICEEIAAAHILAGELYKAKKVLEAIPGDTISAAGKAALAFARSRGKQTS